MMKNKLEQARLSLRNQICKGLELIRRIWGIQFIRFLFTGGINTLFGYTIYTLLILIHLHFSIASLCSAILGILFNFFTTGRIVFSNKDNKLIFKFFGVYGILYLVNVFLLSLFNYIHMDMVLAGGILLLPIALLSYFLNKLLVFSERSAKSSHGE